MYKLCENGNCMNVNSLIMSSLYSNDKVTMNPSIYFDKNHDGIYKHEYLMYDESQFINLIVPLDRNSLVLLSTIKKVEFIFNSAIPDTPTTNDNIDNVKITIKNMRQAVSAFIQYLTYQLISYLPYSDFAIDHMPTMEEVRINGESSTIFSELASNLNKEFDGVNFIHMFKDYSYKYSYCTEFENIKKLRYEYVRINSHFPLFYRIDKRDLKTYRKLDSIEISLRWFDHAKKNYLTEYNDSDVDDYMYSAPGIQGILTLAISYDYLMAYYMNELESMRENYFLIILATGYFKSSSGKFSVRNVYYDTTKFANLLLDLIYSVDSIYNNY